MGMLDDTAVFTEVIKQGGFKHAAKHLGCSTGLVSRRIAQLEKNLGVTLIKRTTRQLNLTKEGELFLQHAERIQQELDSALSLIHSSAKKPKGMIKLSAPLYFGRHYLTPILTKFLHDFDSITIDLVLSNQKLDPIKEQLDLVIRGTGYLDEAKLSNSNLKMKLLIEEKIGLYASHDYLMKQGEPKSIDELSNHVIVNYFNQKHHVHQEIWNFSFHNKQDSITVEPKFNCNDIESALIACISGYGIGKFTELNTKQARLEQQLMPILRDYDFGIYRLYAIYPDQQALPKRTRLLLDYIVAHTKNLSATKMQRVTAERSSTKK